MRSFSPGAVATIALWKSTPMHPTVSTHYRPATEKDTLVIIISALRQFLNKYLLNMLNIMLTGCTTVSLCVR